MSYETGSATSIEDLMTKLSAFAQAAGWTEDRLELTDNNLTLHRDSCFVSFRWDNSPSTDLAVYQSLSYSDVDPHLMSGDSGQGDTTVPIDSGRRVNFVTAGPFIAYHFFAPATGPYYIHVVVEAGADRYRHFGFGNLNKFGTWTGGEYSYGHYWTQATQSDVPTSGGHTIGLDGNNTGIDIAATVRMEGMADQGVSEHWGVFAKTANPGLDRAGEARRACLGGARAHFWSESLFWLHYSQGTTLKPLIPIPCVYYDQNAAPDTWRWMGTQPDVMMVNLNAFSPGQEISVGGSETWIVFPWVKKQYLENDTEESWNAGLAYKKVV